MKKSFVIAAAIALAVSCRAAFAADVAGKVTLLGTPPAEVTIDFTEKPECAALHPEITKTRWYEVKDGGLKDVFVYVSKGCEGKTYPMATNAVELHQRQCMYYPYVMGIRVGQALRIVDDDPSVVMHTVEATSKVDSSEDFIVVQTTLGKVDFKVFSKPEVMVKISCGVHPWMFSYIGVVDNPYFAVTDENGNYKITGLPPGEYTLTAFHVKAHTGTTGISRSIKVEGDKPVTADFVVEIPSSLK